MLQRGLCLAGKNVGARPIVPPSQVEISELDSSRDHDSLCVCRLQASGGSVGPVFWSCLRAFSRPQSLSDRRTSPQKPHARTKPLAVPGRLAGIPVRRMDARAMSAQAQFSWRFLLAPRPSPRYSLGLFIFGFCLAHGHLPFLPCKAHNELARKFSL